MELVGDKKCVAYIPNARDFWTDAVASNEKTEKHRDQFWELGFELQVIDLKDYFGTAKLTKDNF